MAGELDEQFLQSIMLRDPGAAAKGGFAPLMQDYMRLQNEAARRAVAPVDTKDAVKAGYERAIQGQQQQMAGMALASATPEYRDIAGHTYRQGLEAQGPSQMAEGVFTPGQGYTADPGKARDRLTRAVAAQAAAASHAAGAYGQQEDREAARLHQAAALEESKRHARVMEGHSAATLAQAQAAGKLVAFKDANDNPMFMDVRTRQVINPMAGVPGAGAGGAGAVGGKPGAEALRQFSGVAATNKLLDRFETELKNFNPRNPLDVLNPSKRAVMDSLGSQLSLELKEALQLGALTGPDVQMLSDALAKPGGWQAAFYGQGGIQKQLAQVRQSMDARRGQMETMYPRLRTEREPNAPNGAPAPGAPAGAPVERRVTGYGWTG